MSQLTQVSKLLKNTKELEIKRRQLEKEINKNYKTMDTLLRDFLKEIVLPVAEKEGYSVGIYDGNNFVDLSHLLKMEKDIPLYNPIFGVMVDLHFSLGDNRGEINSVLYFEGEKYTPSMILYPLKKDEEFGFKMWKEGESIVSWKIDLDSPEESLRKYLREYKERISKN